MLDAILTMQQQARYRVTGALFLLALAVIFLPMLLDGDGVEVRDLPAVQTTVSGDTSNPAQQYDDIVPDSDVVARVSALHAEIDAEGFSNVDGTRFGEPRLAPVTDQTSVWAVQAGSFAKLDNARNFRGTVRDLGYEAFISSAKDPAGRLHHRVAVGPLLELADARTIRQALEDKLEVGAQIMELQL